MYIITIEAPWIRLIDFLVAYTKVMTETTIKIKRSITEA